MTRAECFERMKVDEDFKHLYNKNYYAAQKRFAKQVEEMKAKRPGVAVTIHHIDENDSEYETWEKVTLLYRDEHVSLHHKGKKRSAEFCAKMAIINAQKTGHPQSEETRRKIGLALKGRPHPPRSAETRLKISLAHKGVPSKCKGQKRKPMSLETRMKMSAAKKGQIPWHKGLHKKPCTPGKISRANMEVNVCGSL